MWGDPYKGQLGLYGDNESWSHEETNLYAIPGEMNLKFLEEGDKPLKVISGGIHSAMVSQNGRLYTWGCGSDGRLGHPEYKGFVYLYKESRPKLVEALKDKKVLDADSSYYQMMCLVQE